MNFHDSLDLALEQIPGNPAEVVWQSLAGGDINQSYRGQYPNGLKVFLKINTTVDLYHFTSEYVGLELLARGTQHLNLRIPKVYGFGYLGNHQSGPRGLLHGTFLLMEWIQPTSNPGSQDWRLAGQELAKLHSDSLIWQGVMDQANPYGLKGQGLTNRIGSTLQQNQPEATWARFFCHHRLVFQWELARTNQLVSMAQSQDFQKLLDSVEAFLPSKPIASLVHGDLWGGNMFFDTQGTGVLIDPAVYFGHNEADLAMTKLFGGFTRDFYLGYREVIPAQLSTQEQNLLEEIYNLYHLLNHLNLFGRSYGSSVDRSIRYIQNHLE
jgi:protein-ribulosamine 3-kinase